MPVHPRACGENPGACLRTRTAVGSSPRMRGKPGRLFEDPDGGRFIPAHAGKTTRPMFTLTDNMVHPRACGENVGQGLGGAEAEGSSPRMRGKRDHEPRRVRARGFIPAHAGKTSDGWTGTLEEWVHPRACGENASRAAQSSAATGSSPRMRGKPAAGAGAVDDRGFIPAHAGKTPGSWCSSPRQRVHPRACGENGFKQLGGSVKDGSSPRMRGKQNQTERKRHVRRLIPAHAGKTPR